VSVLLFYDALARLWELPSLYSVISRMNLSLRSETSR
jgi:hypothetical protein